MTRDGLYKALDRVARTAGYSDDIDVGVGAFITVVFFVVMAWHAWMYPYNGVIVP